MTYGGVVTNQELCPACGTPREDRDRYCPSCAYDFQTGERLQPAPRAPASAAASPPATQDPAVDTELVIVLSFDAHRPLESGCPEPPAGSSEHIFALDRRSLVIGRADGTNLHIPVHGDPYVSRRHAEIIQLGAGWGVRDLGSTNGTKLNGVPLEGAEIKVVRAEDVIELGCFSRLTVRARSRLQPGDARGWNGQQEGRR